MQLLSNQALPPWERHSVNSMDRFRSNSADRSLSVKSALPLLADINRAIAAPKRRVIAYVRVWDDASRRGAPSQRNFSAAFSA